MKIETYEIEAIDQNEIQSLAAEGEALQLIESLGLSGQQTLMNPETKTLLPYRHMTAEEQFTYSVLFPQKSEVAAYKAGAIPLRVLQIIAHVREANIPDMCYLEIWYPKDVKDDPVLIARRNYYSGPIFILARWGDALFPLETLFEKAKIQCHALTRAKLVKIQNSVAAALADVDAYCSAKIDAGLIPEPSFYC